MSDLPQLEQLREVIEPEWDDDRQARLAAGTRTRARRGARRRRVGLAAALAALVALAFVSLGPEHEAEPTADGTIVFEDGTRIRPLIPNTRVVVGEATPELTEVLLHEGGARFEVSREPIRTFAVRAGTVRIEVVGTEFDVRRHAHDDVSVDVFHGLVRVSWPGGTRELGAGDSEVFAQEITQLDPTAFDNLARRHEPLERVPDDESNNSSTASPTATDWRRLAEVGDYGAAYAELEAGAVVADRVDTLMLAADSARLSGRPRMAVSYLQRVVQAHGTDPRSSLAAFTLGRIEMSSGSPGAAARWFSVARQRAGTGSIAEHALAREVEALAAAGNRELAARRAVQYLRRYPDGGRAAAMRRHAPTLE